MKTIYMYNPGEGGGFTRRGNFKPNRIVRGNGLSAVLEPRDFLCSRNKAGKEGGTSGFDGRVCWRGLHNYKGQQTYTYIIDIPDIIDLQLPILLVVRDR